VLTAIVLIFSAVFAIAIIGLTTGIIGPLDGVWKNTFLIFMFLYFLLLAFVIFKIIMQKPITDPKAVENIQPADAVKLSPEQRSEIAEKAAQARWKHKDNQ